MADYVPLPHFLLHSPNLTVHPAQGLSALQTSVDEGFTVCEHSKSRTFTTLPSAFVLLQSTVLILCPLPHVVEHWEQKQITGESKAS